MCPEEPGAGSGTWGRPLGTELWERASAFHEEGLVIFQDPWGGDCWQESPREKEGSRVPGRKTQPWSLKCQPGARRCLLLSWTRGTGGLLDLVSVGEGEGGTWQMLERSQ